MSENRISKIQVNGVGYDIQNIPYTIHNGLANYSSLDVMNAGHHYYGEKAYLNYLPMRYYGDGWCLYVDDHMPFEMIEQNGVLTSLGGHTEEQIKLMLENDGYDENTFEYFIRYHILYTDNEESALTFNDRNCNWYSDTYEIVTGNGFETNESQPLTAFGIKANINDVEEPKVFYRPLSPKLVMKTPINSWSRPRSVSPIFLPDGTGCILGSNYTQIIFINSNDKRSYHDDNYSDVGIVGLDVSEKYEPEEVTYQLAWGQTKTLTLYKGCTVYLRYL